MSDLTTCADSPSATSSLGSGSGPTRYGLQDGLTNRLYGPAPARANLSARQAEERGLLTSGTFGLPSTISSVSANLQSCLENRLRAKTASIGSPLYDLTWKALGMPSGLPICALRASGRRISASGCFSYPTPRAAKRGPRSYPGASAKLVADKRNFHHRLEDQLVCMEQRTGYPNPLFVAWLMGIPEWWNNFTPTGTLSALIRQKSLSKASLKQSKSSTSAKGLC